MDQTQLALQFYRLNPQRKCYEQARVTKADSAIRHQLPVNYELTQVRIVHVAVFNCDCGTIVVSLGAQGLAYTHNTMVALSMPVNTLPHHFATMVVNARRCRPTRRANARPIPCRVVQASGSSSLTLCVHTQLLKHV